MKPAVSIMTLFATVLWASIACSGEKSLTEAEVPSAVISVFKADYPRATDVEYEVKERHGRKIYEIEFKVDGKEHEVSYGPDGKVLKTE